MNPHATGTHDELAIEWFTIPLVFALVALVFLIASPEWRVNAAPQVATQIDLSLPPLDPRLEPCVDDAAATAMQPLAGPVLPRARAGASGAPPASS
jgi:hypothetical protein